MAPYFFSDGTGDRGLMRALLLSIAIAGHLQRLLGRATSLMNTSPRKPDPVLCYSCRREVTGEAYSHDQRSYCAQHWLERQRLMTYIDLDRCYQQQSDAR